MLNTGCEEQAQSDMHITNLDGSGPGNLPKMAGGAYKFWVLHGWHKGNKFEHYVRLKKVFLILASSGQERLTEQRYVDHSTKCRHSRALHEYEQMWSSNRSALELYEVNTFLWCMQS